MQKGAAMLISVVVLATVMLGFALSGSFTSTQELQTLTVLQNKKMAAGGAAACMEHAIDRLGRNSEYGGNETLANGGLSCTVRPITGGGPTWTIETESNVGNQWARYRVTLSERAPPVIASWVEVPTF
ncbi:hypothetical protein HY478_02095 [Candidatus Uhrbacteria bacterium]|nr:hypothetical protein [Candidatus Uhrbacteria bacterium]